MESKVLPEPGKNGMRTGTGSISKSKLTFREIAAFLEIIESAFGILHFLSECDLLVVGHLAHILLRFQLMAMGVD